MAVRVADERRVVTGVVVLAYPRRSLVDTPFAECLRMEAIDGRATRSNKCEVEASTGRLRVWAARHEGKRCLSFVPRWPIPRRPGVSPEPNVAKRSQTGVVKRYRTLEVFDTDRDVIEHRDSAALGQLYDVYFPLFSVARRVRKSFAWSSPTPTVEMR
jgi:hypothetical protein